MSSYGIEAVNRILEAEYRKKANVLSCIA